MSDKEPFVARWARLKRERVKAEAAAPAEAPAGPAPELPPVESLTPQSDFSGFMAAGVEDSVKRAALKKLFSDPHFGGPDLFEPFSGDWTVGETIPQEMLATLNQARSVLLSEAERKQVAEAEAPRRAGASTAEAAPDTADDGAGKQDA